MFPWGKYPFNEEIQKLMQQLNPEDIHSYVSEMMKKVTQGQQQYEEVQRPSENNDTTVFESFDDVFIRLELPTQRLENEMKIFHTSNIVYIDNWDHNGRKKITLPCIVKKKGAIAQIKDNVLQIQIPKSNDLQFTEISVSDNEK